MDNQRDPSTPLRSGRDDGVNADGPYISPAQGNGVILGVVSTAPAITMREGGGMRFGPATPPN